MRPILKVFLSLVCVVQHCGQVERAYADDDELLIDHNGDGLITLLGFGDSITYGVGDGALSAGEDGAIPMSDGSHGYPSRLAALLGVGVDNSGIPGEELGVDGIERFPQVLFQSNADLVLLMEGANDARAPLSQSEYRNSVQRLINVTRASGREIVLFTLAPPCADHVLLRSAMARYSETIHELAVVNGIRVVEIDRAWRTTCSNLENCELYNLPEGLHPNSLGYDVIAQTAAASILGVDIFADSGAEDFAGAVGITPEQVVVKPSVADEG